MIELKEMKNDYVIDILVANNTRKKLVEKVERELHYAIVRIGFDEKNKYTLVSFSKDKEIYGEQDTTYGIAKRCTYSKKEDEHKDCVGITIALLRAMGLSED